MRHGVESEPSALRQNSTEFQHYALQHIAVPYKAELTKKFVLPSGGTETDRRSAVTSRRRVGEEGAEGAGEGGGGGEVGAGEAAGRN
jgi:hypothetical protein